MPIRNLTLTNKEYASLRGCPFCGSFDLELNNTHTACYWISCRYCAVEGITVEVTGKSFSDNYSSEKIPIANHKKAKQSAIDAWNRRAL
jgi:hypothetical protein